MAVNCSASPGHPLADGRPLGTVGADEFLEGSPVVRVEWLEWEGTYTYDVLPGSESGLYWANGILLRSTLYEAARTSATHFVRE